MWTGSRQKSYKEIDRLVHDVILNPQFAVSDLHDFSSTRETAIFDKHVAFGGDGWKESQVSIEVPDGKPHVPPSKPPIFQLPGFQHRSIVEVIKTAWTDSSSKSFHFIPFKQLWCRTKDTIERLYGELYTSDTFLQAHEDIQSLPREEGCKLERVVCALMFWSDSTHLASFGNASLWPLYLFFGNQSKYVRCKPNSGACHHIAYIPKVRLFCCLTRIVADGSNKTMTRLLSFPIPSMIFLLKKLVPLHPPRFLRTAAEN